MKEMQFLGPNIYIEENKHQQRQNVNIPNNNSEHKIYNSSLTLMNKYKTSCTIRQCKMRQRSLIVHVKYIKLSM